MVVAEGLAHKFGRPVVVAVLGLDSGDYERHGGVLCCCEAAEEGELEYCEFRVRSVGSWSVCMRESSAFRCELGYICR